MTQTVSAALARVAFATSFRRPCLAAMLPLSLIAFHAVLLLPEVYGGGPAVLVSARETLEEMRQEHPGMCWCESAHLFAVVRPDEVVLELYRIGTIVHVPREDDGELDDSVLAAVLDEWKDTAYFVDRSDWWIAVDAPDGGVTAGDLMRVIATGHAVGFDDVSITSIEDIVDRGGQR